MTILSFLECDIVHVVPHTVVQDVLLLQLNLTRFVMYLGHAYDLPQTFERFCSALQKNLVHLKTPAYWR